MSFITEIFDMVVHPNRRDAERESQMKQARDATLHLLQSKRKNDRATVENARVTRLLADTLGDKNNGVS